MPDARNLIARRSAWGQLETFPALSKMSVAGGKADAIGTKADIVTRLRLSERSRHLQHGARPVVTVPAWRASAERPSVLAGVEAAIVKGRAQRWLDPRSGIEVDTNTNL